VDLGKIATNCHIFGSYCFSYDLNGAVHRFGGARGTKNLIIFCTAVHEKN